MTRKLVGKLIRSKLANTLIRLIKWYLTSKTFSLAEMETFAQHNNIEIETIIDTSFIQGQKPTFWGGRGSVDFSIYQGTQISPAVHLIKIPNAIAIGRSDLVLKDDIALYPQPFDPLHYSFMLEKERTATVDTNDGRIRMIFRRKSLRVDSAISLLGQCNGNYAHWVLEVLTRAALVETIPSLSGLPFLVDSPVHEKMVDALDILNVSGREIIPVHNAQKVYVRTLFHLTSPSFTPPETRRFFNTGMIDVPRRDQFQFSPTALKILRELAVSEVGQYAAPLYSYSSIQLPADSTFKFVYLSRRPGTTGNGRYVANAMAVERAIRRRGFTPIDMYSLPFEEQVMVLRQAKVVVSPLGAALANLVFCEPGVSVVLLSPYYTGANWYYWTNLMLAAGHRLYIVVGPQAGGGTNEIYHRDFRISLRLLDIAIGEALVDADLDPPPQFKVTTHK